MLNTQESMRLVEAPGARGDESLVLLIPCFNDWGALAKLLPRVDDVLAARELFARVVIVDDGSTLPLDCSALAQSYRAFDQVEVLELRRNLGHQRAITIGLAYIEARIPCAAVVVMDSDGEDAPEDVPRLIERYESEGRRKIVFAERRRRSETRLFRLFYFLYRVVHYLLTGIQVRVGNFSVIPRSRLESLVVVSEMWNHYAAAAFKSKQPFCMIPTRRANRLEGRSKMRFVDLVTHGLSAISVYGETVGVRLFVAAIALICLTLVGISALVALRLFTDIVIPGWASSTVGTLLVVLLLSVMLALGFSFVVLSGRHGSTFLPLRDYQHFIARVRPVHAGAAVRARV